MPSTTKALEALKQAESNTSRLLTLSYSGKPIENGSLVPKAEAQHPPTLSYNSANPTKSYLAISIDFDAPYASLPFLGPALHWIQPGFALSSNSSSSTSTAHDSVHQGELISSAQFIVNWIPPSPPPPGQAHRYAFYLFEEPATFSASRYAPTDGKEVGMGARLRFDFDKWVSEAGLGDVVACGYFLSK